MLSILFFFY